MTLIVEAPPTYEPERRYVLDVLLREWLGLEWRLRLGARRAVRLSLPGAGPGHVLLPEGLFSTEERDWLTPAALPRRPLARCEGLPVLWGWDPPAPALVAADGEEVRVGVDVLGGAFFMLTRYEEMVVADRDVHGRFPAASSLAHQEGFLDMPIVDAYVELLWNALRRAWPRLTRRARAYRTAVTHDVDDPLALLGRRLPGLARQLGADALIRRDPRLAVQRVRSWAAGARGDHRLDPYNTFDFLMDVSERHGLTSAFYFLATEETSLVDGFYTLEHPWIRSLMAGVHRRGHELGFHAGFHTYRDPERTAAEFARLRAATGALGISRRGWGGRQHYLRWENPTTWSNWEHAGLAYDSTVGHAERVGFRAGTSHDFHPFHLRDRRVMRLRERPLHVMDVTLFRHMRLAPEDAAQAVLDIARQCARYGGTLTILWHNSSLSTSRARRWYDAMMDSVAAPM